MRLKYIVSVDELATTQYNFNIQVKMYQLKRKNSKNLLKKLFQKLFT